VHAQVAEFEAQCLSGNTQKASCFVLVSAGVLKDTVQRESVQVTVRFGVQVTRVGLQPLADKFLQPQICIRRAGVVRRGD